MKERMLPYFMLYRNGWFDDDNGGSACHGRYFR